MEINRSSTWLHTVFLNERETDLWQQLALFWWKFFQAAWHNLKTSNFWGFYGLRIVTWSCWADFLSRHLSVPRSPPPTATLGWGQAHSDLRNSFTAHEATKPLTSVTESSHKHLSGASITYQGGAWSGAWSSPSFVISRSETSLFTFASIPLQQTTALCFQAICHGRQYLSQGTLHHLG